jgi:hypothetical protein
MEGMPVSKEVVDRGEVPDVWGVEGAGVEEDLLG